MLRTEPATRRAQSLGLRRRLLLENAASDWLANEIVLYLKRTLKRLDVTSPGH